MRENEIVLRDRFFPDRNYNLSLCSSIDSKRVVVRGNARGEERQLTPAKHTHKERERERERRKRERRKKRTNTHPCIARLRFAPIPSIRRRTFQNAAPSTSRLAAFADDDANAATVVAHAIVFFNALLLLLLFLPRLFLPFVVFAMMMMIDDDENMCRFRRAWAKFTQKEACFDFLEE